MNRRHDLGVLFPSHRFFRRRSRGIHLFASVLVERNSPSIADGAARQIVGRINTNFQHEPLGACVPGDSIPSLQDGQQGILHRILGVLRIANDAPDRPDHAILDGPDNPIVCLLQIVHFYWLNALTVAQPARQNNMLITVTEMGTSFVDIKTGLWGDSAKLRGVPSHVRGILGASGVP